MKRCFFAAGFLAFLAAALPAQTNLQTVATVRLVRTEAITVAQLRAEVEKMEVQKGSPLTREERRQVLDAMIDQRLMLQAAERDRIAVAEGEVNQQIQQFKTAMAQQAGRMPTDAEFYQVIQQQTGLDQAAWREQIRRTLVLQKYVMAKRQAELQGIRAPTEAEITEFYNSNRTALARAETARFSALLVPFGSDRAAARAAADRLAAQIGGDVQKFDEALLRGQAANSNLNYRGGDAGYIPRDARAEEALGREFVSALFALRTGQISPVMENPQGFVIIKVTERYPAKLLEMDDIAMMGTPVTVREFIRQGLTEQRQKETLARIQQELAAELRTGNPFQIVEANLNW